MSGNAKVGTIYVEFVGDTANYQKACDDVQKVNTGLNTGVINLNQSLDLLAKGLDLAREGYQETVGKTIEFSDQIDKLAFITGTSAENIQRLRSGAIATGADFNSVGYSLTMFSQRIAEGGKAGDELNQKLKNIGVSTKDANGQWRDSYTILMETFKKLGEMPNAFERDRLAMEVFGRNWASLAPLIQEYNKAAAAAEATDPISQAKITRAKDFGDRLNIIGSAINKNLIDGGNNLIPILDSILNRLESIGNSRWVKNISDGYNAIYGKVVGTAYMQIGGLTGDLGLVKQGAAMWGVTGDENPNGALGEPAGAGIPASGGTSVFDESGKYVNTSVTSGTASTGGSGGGGSGTVGSGTVGAGTFTGSLGTDIFNAVSTGNLQGVFDAISKYKSTVYKMNNQSVTLPANITKKDIDWAMAQGNIVDADGNPDYNQYNKFLYQIPKSKGGFGSEAPAWNKFANGMTNYDAINPASGTPNDMYGSMGSNISGQAQVGFEQMYNALMKMGDVSGPVKSALSALSSKLGAQRGEQNNINNIITSGSAADRAKLAGSWNNMGMEDIYRVSNSPGVGQITTGDMEQYGGLFSQEFNRLTSGQNAKYDTSGNVIVYLNLDGKQVSQAVFNKLQLLGVKT